MRDRANTASLLTYLQPHQNNFHIKLSMISQDPPVLEKSAFPFKIVNDLNPAARLIEAQVASDAGSKVRSLFLLVQRDHYRIKTDALSPLGNADINASWQKAFSFYAKEIPEGSFILLSGQINKKGGLSPLSSLFYCKTQRVFFHPPCPKCGLLLQQCEEDALLEKSGLRPFAGSLKRYLFCPSCASSEVPDFYAYELEQSDPPTVKDRWSLIREFSLIPETKNNNAAVPCIDCPDRRKCYGADNSAVSRIVPFSFYPFYMLVFEAVPLSAVDFILGWSLLNNSFKNAAWDEESFYQGLESLREEVRDNLLREEVPVSAHTEEKAAPPAEDEALRGILTGLLGKWRSALPEKKEDKFEDIVSETVIISTNKIEKGEKLEVKKAEEEISETVIISPQKTAKEAPGESAKEAEEPEPPQKKKKADEQDFLTETIILKPGDKGKK